MEPPGTAPGSEPLITRTFIAVVHKERYCYNTSFEKLEEGVSKKFISVAHEFSKLDIGLSDY